MKKIMLSFIAILLFLQSCEEELASPVTNFKIEVLDPEKGVIELTEPYQLEVNQEFTITAQNDADFNTFWPGDVLYGSDTIYQIYTEEPKINYRGIDMGEDNETTYLYTTPGQFEFTFISVNVGLAGEKMEKTIYQNTFTIIEEEK